MKSVMNALERAGIPHRWDLRPEEAIALQNRLRSEVIEVSLPLEQVRLVGGADVGFTRDGQQAVAGIVVLRLPSLSLVEQATALMPVTFPYIPGLLSFRETPALLAAWERLSVKPDVLLCDAQGRLHPRRFGLACHVGLWLDQPTIGCAKSLLTGKHAPLGEEEGCWVPVIDRGETIGAALRTQAGTNPLYVSVGHRVDLASAVALVLRCISGARLPEPTRLAHELVTQTVHSKGKEEPKPPSQPMLEF